MIRIGLVGCGHIGTVHALRDPAARRGRADRRRPDRDLRRRPRTRRAGGAAPRRRAGARRSTSSSRGRRGVGVHVDRRAPRSGRAGGRRGPRRCSARSRSPRPRDGERRRGAARSASRTRSASCCAVRRCSRAPPSSSRRGELRPAARGVVPRRPVLPDPGFLRFDVAQGRRARGRRHAHRALDPRHRRAALAARRPGLGLERAHGVPLRPRRASRTSRRSRSPTATVRSPSSPASGTRCCPGSRAATSRCSARARCSGPTTTTSGRCTSRPATGRTRSSVALPEWAGLLHRARGVRQGDRGTTASPSKAFLDAPRRSRHRRASGTRTPATALAAHPSWTGLTRSAARPAATPDIGGERPMMTDRRSRTHRGTWPRPRCSIAGCATMTAGTGTSPNRRHHAPFDEERPCRSPTKSNRS